VTWAVYTVLMKGMHRLYSPVEGPWVSLFGLAAMSPTAVVFKPATLVDPLVLALVAYVAAVPGASACAAWNVAVQPPEVSRGVAPNAVHLFSETLTATQLVGMAVAVAGVYISARD